MRNENTRTFTGGVRGGGGRKDIKGERPIIGGKWEKQKKKIVQRYQQSLIN